MIGLGPGALLGLRTTLADRRVVAQILVDPSGFADEPSPEPSGWWTGGPAALRRLVGARRFRRRTLRQFGELAQYGVETLLIYTREATRQAVHRPGRIPHLRVAVLDAASATPQQDRYRMAELIERQISGLRDSSDASAGVSCNSDTSDTASVKALLVERR